MIRPKKVAIRKKKVAIRNLKKKNQLRRNN